LPSGGSKTFDGPGRSTPTSLRSVLQTGAWCGDGRVFDWMGRRVSILRQRARAPDPSGRLGCFRGRAEIEKALDFVLASVPPRNTFIPVVALAANRHATSLLWDWYVSRLARIEEFHPMLYERVVAAVIPAAGLERPDEVRAFFKEYMRKTNKAVDVVRLSLERLEIKPAPALRQPLTPSLVFDIEPPCAVAIAVGCACAR